MSKHRDFFLAAAVICGSFFGCLAVACWVTSSAWPLLALLVGPRLRFSRDDEARKEK